MPQFESIEGSKRFAIIEALMKNKILVRLTLPSGDYESLTLVTDIQDNNTDPVFLIDPPEGLFDEIARTKSTAFLFEFHSINHVTHRFESELRAVANDSVTLGFPQLIRRHQQRNNFRIKTLHDSYASVCVGDANVRMDIENISLGGVCCLCRNTYKSFFEENLRLSDMGLYLTLRSECFIVPIQRIEVRRLEIRPKPKHFGVAFEFIKINREAQKRLVQQIHLLQREFLQKRLKMPD